MTALSVNVNKVALLRNSREGEIPSVLGAARTVLEAGAAGVTVHPRPDQRHIRPCDCDAIAQLVREEPYQARGVEFNIEGNPLDHSHGDHLMPIIRACKPDQATLVPDDSAQKTSDHGWDLRANSDVVEALVDELHEQDCRVSLFMDPDVAMIELVPRTGADRIELYTEGFAKAHATGSFDAALEGYRRAAACAQALGLGVNAGHDLNLENLAAFLTIPGIAEVSIGHALIADALDMGLEAAVRAYLAITSSDAVVKTART